MWSFAGSWSTLHSITCRQRSFALFGFCESVLARVCTKRKGKYHCWLDYVAQGYFHCKLVLTKRLSKPQCLSSLSGNSKSFYALTNLIMLLWWNFADVTETLNKFCHCRSYVVICPKELSTKLLIFRTLTYSFNCVGETFKEFYLKNNVFGKTN